MILEGIYKDQAGNQVTIYHEGEEATKIQVKITPEIVSEALHLSPRGVPVKTKKDLETEVFKKNGRAYT